MAFGFCLPLAFRFRLCVVCLCPPGLPGFVRPSGGVRLLGGSLVAFVSSVGWRFGSGRGSALFSSPTGNKIGVLYNRGPFPDYKPQRGTKRRFCLKQGFAFLGLVAVGLVFRVAVAGRRAVAAFLAFVWHVGLVRVAVVVPLVWLPQLMPPSRRPLALSLGANFKQCAL